MVNDHLYDKIPRPFILLVQHTTKKKAGRDLIASGPILTTCESCHIRIHGRGGHGSSPKTCVDPIITGAHNLVHLQTIVSCEISPHDFAVVTCGRFKAGRVSNIIPDTADLHIDMRAIKARLWTSLALRFEELCRQNVRLQAWNKHQSSLALEPLRLPSMTSTLHQC